MPLREYLDGPVEIALQHERHDQVLLPLPPRSARDVLGLLMATLGLAVAAREDAKIELLPAKPLTVVLSAGDQPSAAFVMPVVDEDIRQLFGQAEVPRDHLLEQMFEEDRQADLASPDEIIDRHRALAWGKDGGYAC